MLNKRHQLEPLHAQNLAESSKLVGFKIAADLCIEEFKVATKGNPAHVEVEGGRGGGEMSFLVLLHDVFIFWSKTSHP